MKRTPWLIVAFMLQGSWIVAAQSNWTGNIDDDFNNAGNWSAGVPTDIAGFTAGAPTDIIINADTSLNSMVFDATADAYTVTLPGPTQVVNLNVSGIVNNSGNTQSVINNGGQFNFWNNSMAADTSFTVDGAQNGTSLNFWNNASADQSTIEVTNGAGNFSGVQFFNNATAGDSTITIDNGASLNFSDNATAGNSTVTINQGLLNMFGHATTGNAQITLNDGAEANWGTSTTAGNATIIANDGSNASFFGNATAGHATLISNFGGSVNFAGNASAMNATIVNNDGGYTDFADNTTAANAVITNYGSGETDFDDNSTAANATILNNGGEIVFSGTASPGQSRIINNDGDVDFSGSSLSSLSVGSLEGSGSVELGAVALTVGSLNLDADISSQISGDGGSLVKVGNGTLTLSSNDSYTGGTTVNAGTLRMGIDDALPMTGPVVIANSAGTLLDLNGHSQWIGSLAGGGTLGGNITLGAGTLTTGADNTSSLYGGSISGAGSLTKIGSGTFILTGQNSYLGATTVNAGTVRLGAANVLPGLSAVRMANTAAATLDLAGWDQTVGSLAGGGSSGGNVGLGAAALTVGGDNTDTVYSGVISGSGSLTKTGAGTLTLTGSNLYSGDTTVNSGTLMVSGALQSQVIVGPSGSLTGSGTVGMLRNNGRVTPGANGAGTLAMQSYSGPGTLAITLNGRSSTALHVTGNADLSGGKLSVTGTNFTRGIYDVVTAGSLTGAFSSVALPSSALLQFVTTYTPQDVQVIVESYDFGTIAQTANQRAVAVALDQANVNANTGPGNPFSTVLTAISQLSADGARDAYAQISGDALTSFQNAGLQSANVFANQMRDRSGATREETTARLPAPIQLAYAGDAAALGPLGAASRATDSNALWVRGVGYFDRVKADAALGSPESNFNTGGFQAGYDIPLDDDILVGLSAGYAKTDLTVADRSSEGNSNSVQSGLYAGYKPGAWFFNGSLAFTGISNTMTRSIVVPGINEQAVGSFQSRVYSTALEGGYAFAQKGDSAIEPSLALRYSHFQQDGFTESGAPGLNLSVEDETVDSVMSRLGGRFTHRFGPRSSHRPTVGLRAGWNHEWADISNLLAVQFAATSSSNHFIVQGTSRSRDSATLGVDAHMPISDKTELSADYSATISSNEIVHALLGLVSIRW